MNPSKTYKLVTNAERNLQELRTIWKKMSARLREILINNMTINGKQLNDVYKTKRTTGKKKFLFKYLLLSLANLIYINSWNKNITVFSNVLQLLCEQEKYNVFFHKGFRKERLLCHARKKFSVFAISYQVLKTNMQVHYKRIFNNLTNTVKKRWF